MMYVILVLLYKTIGVGLITQFYQAVLVKSSAILNLSAQKNEKQLVLPDIVF